MVGKFLIASETSALRATACALSVTCGDSSPKGRAGAGAPERVQPAEGQQETFPQRRAFAESGAATTVFRYDPHP